MSEATKWTSVSCPVPAHGKQRGDRGASLRIGIMTNGTVIVHCLAGCPTEEVVAVYGCKMRDLFMQKGSKTAAFLAKVPSAEFVERPPADPETLLKIANDAALLAQTDPRLLTAFLAGKLPGADPVWIAKEFDVGVNPNEFTLVIPWWGSDRSAAHGIKYRPADPRASAKWSEGGSKYKEPYGIHRDTGQDTVLLCEGESDTWAAAWALRDKVESVLVLGLPTASRTPDAKAQKRLAGRNVVLAFDPDRAGAMATERWTTALHAARGVWYVPVPDGKDLASVGVDALPGVLAGRKPIVDAGAGANVEGSSSRPPLVIQAPTAEAITNKDKTWAIEASAAALVQYVERHEGNLDIEALSKFMEALPLPQDPMTQAQLRERLKVALRSRRVGISMVSAWKVEEEPTAEPGVVFEAPVPVSMPALALKPDILEEFSQTIARWVVGERTATRLLFLSLNSRLMVRRKVVPVSITVKGESAGGKSFIVEMVLTFVPEHVYWTRTTVSPKAIAYTSDSLVRRYVILYEAETLQDEDSTAGYILRSLLSEGRIDHQTVINGQDVHLYKEGPTGLVTTTTAAALFNDLETRTFSVTVADTPEQTRAVLLALAQEEAEEGDLTEWHQLQQWLEQQDNRVTIPYAPVVANLIPPVAVRLRRDFERVLALVRSHAILHQATRERDEGRIIATEADYEAVRHLVGTLTAEGVGLTVSDEVRTIVEAVGGLTIGDNTNPLFAGANLRPEGVSVTEVAKALGIHKATASRRLVVAAAHGHVTNLETRTGLSARYTLGDAIPDGMTALPELPADWRSMGL